MSPPLGSDPFSEREALRRRALRLVWIGEVWNGLEVAVGLSSGIGAGSVALLAFALDSGIELFAGLILIWRLGAEWSRRNEKAAERKAYRIVGLTFFVLAAYIAVHASTTLAGWVAEPGESPLGIAIVISSALAMAVLYLKKSKIATRLGSKALRAEAIETLVCDLQDLTIMVGLALNTLLGWWWADPVAALALIPFLIHEGREVSAEE